MRHIFKFLPGGSVYTIKLGDTLSKIARNNGISVDLLLALNPQITNADNISAGQTINLPKTLLINKPDVNTANTVLTTYDLMVPSSTGTKRITNDNYVETLINFQKAFEEFNSHVKRTKNTHGGYTDVLGYGMSFYINPDGTKRDFKPGETITELDADTQLRLWHKLWSPKELKTLKLNNFDKYDPEVKFTLLDAIFNGGSGMISERSPNYFGQLKLYDLSFDNNTYYDIANLQKHADWNRYDKNKKGLLIDNGWIGLRSLYRLFPNLFDYDFSTTYHKPDAWVLSTKHDWMKKAGIVNKARYLLGGVILNYSNLMLQNLRSAYIIKRLK